MDYSDMADSLRKQQSNAVKEEMVDLTIPPKGFYEGCKKWDHELEELCLEMDRNSTVRVMSPEESSKYMRGMTGRHYHTPTSEGMGRRPAIAEFVDIAKTMTQGSLVSLYQ